MQLRHALLGLLTENSGHGYGLRQSLLHRLGHFRNVNEGQLYTELSRMEKEGLARREVVVPEKGPARKLIHITAEGKRLFRGWLLSDQHEDRGVLYDFMQGYPFFSKCSFFKHLKPVEILEKVERQLTLVREKQDAYREILTAMKDRKADPFRIRILEFGLREMEHRLQWLEEIRQELQNGPQKESKPCKPRRSAPSRKNTSGRP